MTGAATAPITLWDLPVRLVHWSFAALIPALWWSAESGRLELHETLGLVMLALVVFRLLWGLFGSSTARFSTFVRGPAAIRAYLATARSGLAAPLVGHNPLGALSVLALLGLLALQVSLGLFAQDTDAVESGPLNHLVGYDLARTLSEAHELVFNLIIAMVALHLAAILYYRLVRKDDLVRPMLTGRRAFPAGVEAPRIAPLWKAALLALLSGLVALWLAWGAPPWGARFPWDQPAASAQLDSSTYM